MKFAPKWERLTICESLPSKAHYAAAGLRFSERHFTSLFMGQTDFALTGALIELLVNVDKRAGVDFSGTGVIVTTRVDDLPILAMRPVSDPGEVANVADLLAAISNPAHEHHDGFHVLDPDLRILRLGQYFSPPIVLSAQIDRTKRFGGRYLAALFGSTLPSVLATGIASCDFGIALFRNGQEIAYRRGRSAEAAAEKKRAK
jgi:hypothetical protein